MKKRFLSAALSLALCLSLTAPALAAAPSFSDVPETHWSYSYVERAAGNGWVSGMGGGLYAPSQPVSYAQFLTMVTQMFYPGEVRIYVDTTPFGVPWWTPYAEVALDYGLLTGTDLFLSDLYPDYFMTGEIPAAAVTAPLNRYELAEIMDALLIDLGDGSLSADMFRYTDAAGHIADWDRIPSRHQAAVGDCYCFGLLSGYTDGSFGGEKYMTRAEAAVVLCKLADTLYFALEEQPPAPPERPAQPEPEPEPLPSGPEPGTSEHLLANGQPITEANVLAILNGLRGSYPEGMRWNNENSYYSPAMYTIGYGCAGFALICSDAAFGSLPLARTHSVFEDIKVGDMVRTNHDTHSVVVLEKRADRIVVAEGNYNSSIHWDREITRQELELGAYYVETRYPQ